MGRTSVPPGILVRIPGSPQHYFFVPVYHRRLPHIYDIGKPLFVTWRLAGSLPEHRHFTSSHLTGEKAFVAFDHLLDCARTGPLYLAHPAIAEMLVEYLRRLARSEGVYELQSFAIMPNQVHVLISPNVPLPQAMKLVKGGTARLANRMLSSSGQTFWQEEFFDHLVRNGEEFRRIRNYIEFNPVRAGLCSSPEEFQYSSAWRGGEVGSPGRD